MAGLRLLSHPDAGRLAWIGALLGLGILVEAFPVRFGTLDGGGSVTLAGFVAAATAVLYGWPAAALVAPLARTLVAVTERRGLDRLVYNAGLYALAGGAAGSLASVVGDRNVAHTFAAVALAMVGFYIPLVVLVPAAIARSTRRRFLPIVIETVRLTAPFFALMASPSLMLVVLWRVSPSYAAALVGPLLATALYQRSSSRTLEAMRLALTDPLTGLGNHRHFHEQLERELDRAADSGRSVSLCLFDVDDFKRVNDTHGHPIGDETLRAVAAALRGGREAFRVGGDEFALLLPSKDEREASSVVDTVLERLAEVECRGETLTFSAGLASFPRHASERTELLRVADVALYVAKRDGKNQLRVAEEPEPAQVAEATG